MSPDGPNMDERWSVEGNLFLSPGRWQYGRLTVAGGVIRSVEPLVGRTPDGTISIDPEMTPHDLAPLPGPERAFKLRDGLVLLPGFIDGHTHLLGVGLAPLKPDLHEAKSRDEVLDRLATWLAAHPGETPVVGEGWDQSIWPDPRFPTRRELDRIAPRRPLAARRICGHIAVLNSRALEMLGSSWADLDPETGEAREALPLALSRLWPPTDEERDRAVAIGQGEAWREGVTGIQEMGQRSSFEPFARAARNQSLHLRVTHFVGHESLDWLIEKSGADPASGNSGAHGGYFEVLRLGGLKLFLDGSIGGRSAALRLPYLRREGEALPGGGLLLWEDEKLEEILARASRAGWQVVMHAIGDRAIEQAIATVERLRGRGIRPAAPGPRIEHAEMLDAELLDRGVAAGFLFSMQPNFTARWQNPGELYEEALGAERARRLNPYRSVADRGCLLFGSDTMPLNPRLGLKGALLHPEAGERLTLEQALQAYTGAPALGVTHPFRHGRIEPGARADLVALDWPMGPGGADTRGAHGAIHGRVRVAGTWIDGVLRFRGGEGEAA
jgi:predicted amidohydrolase YtcJ